jgi:hypothetical protein
MSLAQSYDGWLFHQEKDQPRRARLGGIRAVHRQQLAARATADNLRYARWLLVGEPQALRLTVPSAEGTIKRRQKPL